MKLNQTQQAVLRHIFGFDDMSSDRQVGISSRGSPMAIIKGSREWQFAQVLANLGVAKIIKKPIGTTDFWYVERAVCEQGKTLCEIFKDPS